MQLMHLKNVCICAHLEIREQLCELVPSFWGFQGSKVCHWVYIAGAFTRGVFSAAYNSHILENYGVSEFQ